MRLELTRDDLKPEFAKTINCSQTEFKHFKAEVQAAILLVGRSMYNEDRDDPVRASYNAIYPPKKSPAMPYLDMHSGEEWLASEWHPPSTLPGEGESFVDEFGVTVSNTEKGVLAFLCNSHGGRDFVQPGDYILFREKRKIVKPEFLKKYYMPVS